MVQNMGCADYLIYKNEADYIVELFTLNGLLPFGHHGVVGMKPLYSTPRREELTRKYSCDLFTGQVTIVLTNKDLYELFIRELTGKLLGGNKLHCEMQTPRVLLKVERSRSWGSTRTGSDIWEFHDQWSDSLGTLEDPTDYSADYQVETGFPWRG